MSDLLAWFVGKQLLEATKQDYTWLFSFPNKTCIVTESVWRLTTASGIVVTSEDHGHLFGLSSPVDACARVNALIAGKKITALRIAVRTSDLLLDFENNVTVEFLNLSCGYESWRAYYDAKTIICIGGGKTATYLDGNSYPLS